MKTWNTLFVVVAIACFAGCGTAGSNRETWPTLKLTSDIKAINLAVRDQRPDVKSGKVSEKYFGTFQLFGVLPTNYDNFSRQTMAAEMASSISSAFKDQTVRVYSTETSVATSKEVIVEKLTSAPAPTSILITIHDWRIQSFPLGAKYPFTYKLEIEVLNKGGALLATKAHAGEDVFIAPTIPFAAYQAKYKRIMEDLIGDEDILKAIESYATPLSR